MQKIKHQIFLFFMMVTNLCYTSGSNDKPPLILQPIISPRGTHVTYPENQTAERDVVYVVPAKASIFRCNNGRGGRDFVAIQSIKVLVLNNSHIARNVIFEEPRSEPGIVYLLGGSSIGGEIIGGRLADNKEIEAMLEHDN